MPELPEVETTLRGIKPHIHHAIVTDVIIRHPTLRWPIPANLKKLLQDKEVKKVYRRAKYLLLEFVNGTLILHLGMSGKISILSQPIPPKKHDHLDICFDNGKCLRFTDPRRFGAALWEKDDITSHVLLKNIGPEPLTKEFVGDYLWEKAQKRKAPVKSFIMDSRIVAGVGNIYATEALFQAKINPKLAAGKVTLEQYRKLAKAIQAILTKAIEKGGTTLKDFAKSDGSPGYFSIALKVYGREGKPCPRCKTTLKLTRIGQRSTVYCPQCQK